METRSVQDLQSYEEIQDSFNLLRILAQSTKSKDEGDFEGVSDTFQSVRARIKELS